MVVHSPAALSTAEAALEASALDVRVAGRELVSGLDLKLMPGEFLAVLGCNGCGKTLTLLTLAGLRAAAGGEVRLQNESIAELGARQRARRLAFLPQDLDAWGAEQAIEAVRIGRYAHAPSWLAGSADDEAIVSEAMQRAEVDSLAQRATVTLSGGEQRRVAIAAVLAQRAAVVLLDEPTNHLDPQHAIAMLDLFAAHVRDGGSVVATLHDPTLAARFATHALLLYGDGRWESGAAAELLRADRLSGLYRTPIVEALIGARRVFAAD